MSYFLDTALARVEAELAARPTPTWKHLLTARVELNRITGATIGRHRRAGAR